MENWLNFYRPFFPSEEALQGFVVACEQLTPPDNLAKIVMHQCQRLISLSDEIANIRPNREALQLLFLMICAENISKLHDSFEEEGQSRRYVRKFFDDFLDENDKDTISIGFTDHSIQPMLNLSFRDAIDMLYDVRCDVVHEGNYWGFMFHDGQIPVLNNDPDIISNITFDQLRIIFIRGCINAIQDMLPGEL
jgi:hypothetical protein